MATYYFIHCTRLDGQVRLIILLCLWCLIFRFSLVQCYLSTSYYLIPFLHVPTFLAVRLFGCLMPLIT